MAGSGQYQHAADAETNNSSSGNGTQRRSPTPSAGSHSKGALRAIPALNCPSGVVETVPAGSDLNTVAATAGKTYELDPGNYFIRSTISLSTAATTCCVGTGSSRTDVKVFISTPSAGNSGRAFAVSGGAILGLEKLVLDGGRTNIQAFKSMAEQLLSQRCTPLT